MSTKTDNNRIVKNTLFMYLRMFITVGVSLYTSRIVLKTLGVEDYGLYNVIGGIILMFSFINGAMVNTTSRFITFYLGKDENQLTNIFNMAILIHAGIALIIVLLGESLGLWFLQNKMTIPDGRMVAAHWLYQLSVANMVLSILIVPFNSTIVAHEKLSAFAYISILDAFLKLGIVFLLFVSPFDKLILYGSLLFLVQLLNISIYYIYCKRNFKETILKPYWSKKTFKEMYGVASWSILGNFSFLFYNEGLNLILNMFCGPAVNAARGIAIQIDNVIRQFSSNIQTAINPQIIKSYSTNRLDRMYELIFASSRYCFYLLFFLSLPLCLEADFVLSLWLGEYPEHTISFLRLTMITVLLETLSGPMFIANLASGKVKIYQITISVISYLFMPITYICVKETEIPEMVFICLAIVDIICMIARIFIIRYQIGLPIKSYITRVLVKIMLVVSLSSIIPIMSYLYMDKGIVRFLLVGMISIISTSIVVYYCGITQSERQSAKYYIKSKLKR